MADFSAPFCEPRFVNSRANTLTCSSTSLLYIYIGNQDPQGQFENATIHSWRMKKGLEVPRVARHSRNRESFAQWGTSRPGDSAQEVLWQHPGQGQSMYFVAVEGAEERNVAFRKDSDESFASLVWVAPASETLR
ncbi:hypothetical protein KM043_005134 [Ampulex compressa]|nr:hypothetical protein KM043_005134 [Ampulex compressa]